MQPDIQANPQPPTPPQTPTQPTPPTPTTPQPGASDPGATLAIIGIVLAFIFTPAGLILGLIARSKSKAAGFKNTVATVAIVINSIIILGATLFAVGMIALGSFAAKKVEVSSTSSSQPQAGDAVTQSGDTPTTPTVAPTSCLVASDFKGLPGAYADQFDYTGGITKYTRDFSFKINSTELVDESNSAMLSDIQAVADFAKKHTAKKFAIEVKGGAYNSNDSAAGIALSNNRADTIIKMLTAAGAPSNKLVRLDPLKLAPGDENNPIYQDSARRVNLLVNTDCSK